MIFFSYSREDLVAMHRIKQALQQGGVSVWTDENLTPGTSNWMRAIDRNLKKCDAVVVLLSPAAYKSKWVDSECGKAEAYGKEIFPLLIKGEPEDAVPLSLWFYQRIDLRRKFDGGVLTLIKTLRLRGFCNDDSMTGGKKQHLETPAEISQPIVDVPGNELTVTLARGVEMVFVRVPAGGFWMGSDEDEPDADDDEKQRHKVYLDVYWIGKYPVTNAQFAAYVKATGYKTSAEKIGYSWVWDFEKKEGKKVNGIYWRKPQIDQNGIAKISDHPVVHVSWKDAQAFCLWASRVSGYSIYLPSEAEWEKAARSVDGRKYPWGNEKPNSRLLNFNMNIGGTTAVGSYPGGVSPCGALDMAGNVWEWMADWYGEDYYQKSPPRNPTGPSKGEYRVLRGGSWDYNERNVRSAYRNWFNPDLRNSDFLGFRCATSP